jgi:hypothetical protein
VRRPLAATAFGGALLVISVLFAILLAVAGAMLTVQERGGAGAVQALNELVRRADAGQAGRRTRDGIARAKPTALLDYRAAPPKMQ